MFLSESEFSKVIKWTPLVSIDLCILKGREILVGRRVNPPAKNYFFVPGGRILKLEQKKDALIRILRNELGMTLKNHNHNMMKEMGTYEHFYEDNFFNNNDFGTHYLVMPYLIPYEELKQLDLVIKDEQHSEYSWINIDTIKHCSLKIHSYTLDYLKNPLFKKNTK